MAKRSVDERHSIGLESGQDEEIKDLPAAFVRLVLARDIVLKINGPVTGKQYVFNRAGSMVDVDASDVPGLLLKRSKSSCCSGETSPYFDVVGGSS